MKKILEVGSKAPDFTLTGSDRKEHRLSDYKGKKVILYFYPKDNTPGCTIEAEGFRDSSSDLSALNAVVLGVSRDSLNSHDKFIDKFSLPFILLSDPDSVVCEEYDVLKEKTMFGKTSIGIQRSTFVIDEEGIIIYMNRKVTAGGHSEEIANFIRSIS